jgi:hypothetical protein
MKKIFFTLLLTFGLILVGCESPSSPPPVVQPDTPAPIPLALTKKAVVNTATTAVLNGIVNGKGKSTTVFFRYGLSTAYGSTVDATPNVIIDSNIVIATVSNLLPNTIYHFQVVATNGAKVAYGDDSVFVTKSNLSIGDQIDGGIIIYLSSDSLSQHGLLAAPADQSDSTKNLSC